MRLAVMFLVVVATACTRHHHIASLTPGKRVTVETVDGAEVPASVVFHPSELVLADASGRILHTQHIARVVDVRRGRGAIDGALIGGLSGLAFGVVLGLSAGDDHCGEGCILSLSAEDKAALAGSMFGVLGGGVGAIVGAVVGSRDVYLFGDALEARITPKGPQGSVAGLTAEF